MHNTPFGDIVDTEDDLQPLVASMFRDATPRRRAGGGGDARGAEFDVARLEARAAEGGTTLTELADHLVREHGIPFRTRARDRRAHAAAGAARRRQRRWRAIARDASRATCSACRLRYTDAQIAEILSPRHFVDVRGRPADRRPPKPPRAVGQSREAARGATARG